MKHCKTSTAQWRQAGVLAGGLLAGSIALAGSAHVHGEARLEAVQEGQTLALHLEAPLEVLLGFEHQPANRAQQEAVDALAATLKQPERLFVLPAAAHCQPRPVRLVSPVLATEQKSPGPKPQEVQHLDMEADYQWQCGQTGQLREFSLAPLFVRFQRLRQLRLDYVGPRAQHSQTLSAKQPVFRW